MTTVRYLSCPLPQDFSSIPVIRSPSSRSVRAAASAAAQATMFCSASQVTRSSAAALVQATCAASQAAWSSNGLVNRSSCVVLLATARLVWQALTEALRRMGDSMARRSRLARPGR